MIEDPYPADWKALQAGVARLFNEIGLKAETEVKVATPRGEVEIDVLAVDEGSVDRIRYVVECKNWSSAIPQAVVHSFTTVMHETGANIGFIVSQNGLQVGAERYTNSTNIVGMTYLELQQRYFSLWWERCFCRDIGDVAEELMDFVEPVNRRRDELVKSLSAEKAEHFVSLQNCFGSLAMVMTFMNMGKYVNMENWYNKDSKFANPPNSLEEFRAKASAVWPHFRWHEANDFRQIKTLITEILREAHWRFKDVFGGEINDVYEQKVAKAT